MHPIRPAIWFLLLSCAASPLAGSSANPIKRSLPQPLSDHPGNIFVQGESILIRQPKSLPATNWSWELRDDRGKVIQQGPMLRSAAGRERILRLARLAVGWYRLEFRDTQGALIHWTSLGVLAPLRAPVPEDSPVCVDSATAWFARNETEQRQLASLAALAGVNWVRDRLRWRELEPEAGLLADRNKYDTAADIQAEWGLRVLQVFHDTPPWARSDSAAGGRFARDLRTVHDFCQAMAQRFHGRVQAWEPWNEANVKTFGGQTVDEMCSWQKAAWLGFKRGDPRVLVGWNPTAAVPTQPHTDGLLANEVWNYFDTYNFHSYDWPHSYLELWQPARAAACGRPIWITEADRGMKHENNPPWFDLSPEGERLKAELVAQEYAQSLFAGARRHFHFILGQYHEPNGVQFGLLRLDLTPRPAYVALAAVGRFLAGARCLGRWLPAPDVHVVAFDARPDGQAQDVLVMWAEKDVDWAARGKTTAPWPLPNKLPIKAVLDYLGRQLNPDALKELRSAPVFVLLPAGASRQLPLEPPPTSSKQPASPPSRVVLQVEFPESARVRVEDKPWSEGFAWSFRPGQRLSFKLWVYDFGNSPVAGEISVVDAPKGWTVHPERWKVKAAPNERLSLEGNLTVATTNGLAARDGWVKLRGDFGAAGQPVVAFRMVDRQQ